ncbi:hypothetical protein [Paractinoplanes toevensis]|uniref:Neocarzinostatin n=1 Tax=Paractinoplanes toevensis TaxID=571911 RepID=A0A919TGK5_9ACTN|nr:hypothetical protein [Actinoplanes toevensis]GIM93719.1 hypothetical protein Ato02nite_055120 [Actinoplanes toevensis]
MSKTKGLARSGETVTVSGSGYDATKGIYVAFCLDNGAGVLPSPCGGGADLSGSSGGSAWISSNPPAYGEGLATPYGKNGSFRVSIQVSQMIGDVDCAVRGCAIVTRADHTRTSDRSQDMRIPVRFAAAATGSASGSGVAVTAAPGKSAPAVKQSKPVGPPTGKLATEAPPSAEATEPVELQAFGPTLTRTSTATPLGHWWAIGGAFLTGLLLAVLVGRFGRRSR